MGQSTLKSILDQRKTDWEQKASADRKQVYQEGIDAVIRDGVYDQAKNIGDQAPDFVLSNATGQAIQLSNLLEKGPVVLTWYRGGWCPYCNLTLQYLQQSLPAIQAAGGQLVALTPELPDQSLSTAQKHDLTFEVLSDVGNVVARNYGIVFKLIPEVAAIYQKAFDLHAYNGDETDELPLAATYVIDQAGVIQYAFLDAEYRNRAEPSDILSALNRIG